MKEKCHLDPVNHKLEVVTYLQSSTGYNRLTQNVTGPVTPTARYLLLTVFHQWPGLNPGWGMQESYQ